MKTEEFKWEKTQPFTNEIYTNPSSLNGVFNEINGGYINESNLFITRFNYIPNLIKEDGIDCVKANLWFREKYKTEIKDYYFCKRLFGANKSIEYDDIFYFLYDDLIVNFDTNSEEVRFLFKKTSISKVEECIRAIRKFYNCKNGQVSRIFLLIHMFGSMSTKELEITKPRLTISDNYNDDFLEIHSTILKRLKKKNDKGLILLHGKPGTGKTSYIRYLISSIKKNVIFLPPSMASAMTDPGFMPVLIQNPNSVFIIEDAENIIVDRVKDGNSPVSALLNISDGLLSDCLNIQIICSFNTDISRVDNALMRKGRLIAKYEFKELEKEKAQKLSDKLGFDSTIDTSMTLTDIYNQQETAFQKVPIRNVIGFHAAI